MAPPTVADADALAARAHHGQVDKAGRPYIDHPRAVAATLAGFGDHAVMAGLLHDVVEDTGVTLHDLRAAGYPEEVVRAVDAVTRRPDEPYLDMIRRAAADPLGRLVKLADNGHNSDPARLALLPAAQAGRLRERYAEARAVLTAAADSTRPPTAGPG
ncbi:HD domain-containing protein [Micromonospora echinofusca]|uniref:HD domain-containing protein n=1 Tax=Micromonospora echinofusca TaxID=47858 RepID=A0ABS3VK35_MICEH|nr:HD domain-containing protein [Micromonospora echinofusca]MBO4204838.1 HD domain-containing protein [Micromonospora echinofusca]